MDYSFLVGTYSKTIVFPNGKSIDGKGKGLYLLNYSATQNSLTIKGIISDHYNPSYFAVTDNTIITVNECNDYKGAVGTGGVSVYNYNLFSKNVCSVSNGIDPCFVSISPDGRFFIVCNYTSGSLAVFSLSDEKIIQTDFVKHLQVGTKTPHVHSVYFSADSKYVFVVDLGLDTITSYQFNDGTLCKSFVLELPDGFAPRHAVFYNESLLYVLSEKKACIGLVSISSDGKLNLELIIQPSREQDTYSCSEIHIDSNNNILYTADRFSSTITRYRISSNGLCVSYIDEIKLSNGKPRSFTVSKDGKYLLICEQANNKVSVWENTLSAIDIKELNSIIIPSCVCIKEIEKNGGIS